MSIYMGLASAWHAVEVIQSHHEQGQDQKP